MFVSKRNDIYVLMAFMSFNSPELDLKVPDWLFLVFMVPDCYLFKNQTNILVKLCALYPLQFYNL